MKVVAVFMLASILLAVITYNYWLTAIARWLIVSDHVVPVDLIVVSSGSRERIQYAIQLWKQGIASQILVLSPNWKVPGVRKRIGELIVAEMILEGIPQEAILTDFHSQSTYDDAVYSRKRALKLGVTSLIAIEDPFGMRRLQWTFRKVFAGTGIQIHCVAVPPELSDLNVEKWWTRENELLYVFEEYVKLILYWLKY